MTSSTLNTQLAMLVNDAVAAQRIPGAVLRIEKQGLCVFEQAFGRHNVERDIAQQPQDRFFLASATKPIAASVIAAVCDDGLLDLDSPPLRQLPQLHRLSLRDGERVRAPKLNEMLSHMAGMFGVHGASEQQKKLLWNFDVPLATAVERILAQPLDYPPSKSFSYGGASILAAARAAEIATGQDFEQLLRTYITAPLGMSDTTYRPHAGGRRRPVSPLYRPQQDRQSGFERSKFQPPGKDAALLLASGGLISTAQDLARFIHMHIKAGVWNNKPVLSPTTAVRCHHDHGHGLVRPQKANETDDGVLRRARGYGLGWTLQELNADGNANVIYHSGASGSLLWADLTTGLNIVLLTHVMQTDLSELWDAIVKTSKEL